ncbi:uncharacterized protein LOC132280750 [Cornus florida]|uniref:uncharacterized protein LOC132280750 n=1 Tax=Cornus florida TaxID=4283 RepID=UPI0028A13E19|nr:uncharacterized protein LOC132280750 [Cornus florida]
MSNIRANSAPDLLPSSTSTNRRDHSSLEGVAANVKLLLKLIQDHNEACAKEKNDSRRMLRVAGMMTILDNVRTRIQKCQSFGLKKEAELRRCNTDVKSSNVPMDKRIMEPIADEKEKLRRKLAGSLAARKSLEIMCSSLGKEKEIMAAELSRKVHELTGMEELINDLKAQNETLLERVHECAAQHKSGGGLERQGQVYAALQERNRALSEQLLRSLDGYKSMKRKLREAKEENGAMRGTMEEMVAEVGAGLERIRSFKQRITTGSEPGIDIEEEEISQLENMFECFEVKLTKHGQNTGECVKPKGEINASQPSVLA